MNHDVYICYSSQDKAIADAVVFTLEEQGVACWMAPRDMPPGAPWAETLVEAITTSRFMVLILSESAGGSAHLAREAGLAADSEIGTIVFAVDATDASPALTYVLGTPWVWIDASPEPADHLGRLTAEIRGLLRAGSPESRSTQGRFRWFGRFRRRT